MFDQGEGTHSNTYAKDWLISQWALKAQPMSANQKVQTSSKNWFHCLLIVLSALRIGGPHYFEFHQDRTVFDTEQEKISASNAPDAKDEFALLFSVTDKYDIWNDVCETFEAVYDLLKLLHAAHVV